MTRTTVRSDLSAERILIVVNVDWFLISHRLPIAVAAKERGATVGLACADTGQCDSLREMGFEVFAIPLTRSGTRIRSELRSVWSLFKVIRQFRPSVVHNVTIKPVIYGTLITRLTRRRTRVVDAISGFGFAVESSAPPLIRILTRAAYSAIFRSRRVTVIVQNEHARDRIVDEFGVPADRVRLVSGSGVDTSTFSPPVDRSPMSRNNVLFAGRLLRDKGVVEYMEAAAIVKRQRPETQFLLAGGLDEGGNPTALCTEAVDEMCERYGVGRLGEVDDMAALLRGVGLLVLPSYHEGLPKVLLEGAASGLPLVATDIPGCRPIVRPAVNGELVPPRSSRALAEAISTLLSDVERMNRYGLASRELACGSFDISTIVELTLDTYTSGSVRALRGSHD